MDTTYSPLPVPVSENEYKRHENSYIVHGATVKCTSGGGSTTTLNIPDRGSHTGYGKKAMHTDTNSSNFAAPFATCVVDPNKECTLSPLNSVWDRSGKYIAYTTVPYKQEDDQGTTQAQAPFGIYPIDIFSTLVCWKGGMIRIEDNGQMSDLDRARLKKIEQEIADLLAEYAALRYATGEQRKEYREKLNALIRQAEEIKRPGYYDTVLAGLESAVKNTDRAEYERWLSLMGEMREPYTKIPKEVYLTQGVGESGGDSEAAINKHNLFGILYMNEETEKRENVPYDSLEIGLAAYDLNYYGNNGKYEELFDIQEKDGDPIWKQWAMRLGPDDLAYSTDDVGYGQDLVDMYEGGLNKNFE